MYDSLLTNECNYTSNLVPGTHYINWVIQDRKKVSTRRYTMTREEKKEIMQKLGDQAYMLYDYYLYAVSTPSPLMEDIDVAKHLFWDKSKVRRYRYKLMKLGYFRRRAGRRTVPRREINYFVGREAVLASLNADKAENLEEELV